MQGLKVTLAVPEKHIIIFWGITVNKMNHLNNFAFQEKMAVTSILCKLSKRDLFKVQCVL